MFENIQAESWVHYDEKKKTFDDSRINELRIGESTKRFDNRDDALEYALKVDEDEDMGGTEYGVQFERLCKDGAEVKIIP